MIHFCPLCQIIRFLIYEWYRITDYALAQCGANPENSYSPEVLARLKSASDAFNANVDYLNRVIAENDPHFRVVVIAPANDVLSDPLEKDPQKLKAGDQAAEKYGDDVFIKGEY